MRLGACVCAVSLGLALFALPATAGMITASFPDPGVTVFPPIHMLQNNDDQPVDNFLFASKVFVNAVMGVGTTLDVQFSVANTGTAAPEVNEYLVQESVDNDTGLPWTAYQVLLGFGTGANFQPSPAGDGLDFDVPNTDGSLGPTSSVFATVTPTEDVLTFSNGLQGSAAANYGFRIDVPDGIQTFTLRQIATPVPEPSALALLAVAVAGLGFVFRRRRTA